MHFDRLSTISHSAKLNLDEIFDDLVRPFGGQKHVI